MMKNLLSKILLFALTMTQINVVVVNYAGVYYFAPEKYGIDVRRSFMIGDRWKDVEAGKSAGCRTIFLDRGYNEPINCQPDHIVSSLLSCERFILGD